MTGIERDEPDVQSPQPEPDWLSPDLPWATHPAAPEDPDQAAGPDPAPADPVWDPTPAPPPAPKRVHWRPLGALLCFAAALMTLFGSFLTLFTSDISAPNDEHYVLTVSGWGTQATTNGAPDPDGPVSFFATNGPPLIFAACVLLVAAVVALLAAAAPASGPIGRISTIAAVAGTAFLAGTTWTVGMQELNWLDFFSPSGPFALGPGYEVATTINVGFWLLVTGTAVAIAGAVFAFLPLRSRSVPPREEPDTPRFGIPAAVVVHRLPDEPPDEPR